MTCLDSGGQRSRSQQAVEVAKASTSTLGHRSQILQCVPKICQPFYFLSNCQKLILMIFGVWYYEKIWHQKLINLRTFPGSCSHITLRYPKKSFSIAVSLIRRPTSGCLRHLSKTMHQHITLATRSSFCALRHPSSTVLTCGQPTVLT